MFTAYSKMVDHNKKAIAKTSKRKAARIKEAKQRQATRNNRACSLEAKKQLDIIRAKYKANKSSIDGANFGSLANTRNSSNVVGIYR